MQEEFTLENFRRMDWRVFEQFCFKMFILYGKSAEMTQNGADGGIDIVIRVLNKKTGTVEKIAVQCKRKSNSNVGIKDIREFFGVIKSKNFVEGIFISSTGFTEDAIQFASEARIKTITGDSLTKIKKILNIDDYNMLINEIFINGWDVQTCPRCLIKMKLRTSNKGSNIGHEFWGCINYPACKSVINLSRIDD